MCEWPNSASTSISGTGLASTSISVLAPFDPLMASVVPFEPRSGPFSIASPKLITILIKSVLAYFDPYGERPPALEIVVIRGHS
jgi:hypothetical protein